MAKKDAPPNLAGPEKPAGKLKMIILMLIVVLLAVGLSIGGTWFFLNQKSAGDGQDAKAENAAQNAVPVKQPAIYEELSPAFVMNFNHEGRARYLQVSVALMARDQAALDALKVHMPVLRNRLVMLFSNADWTSLMTAPGKEMLRQQATAGVQELAQKETGQVTVEQVLFTNFVLQ